MPDGGTSSGDPPAEWVPNGPAGGTLHGRVATADGVTGTVSNSMPEESVLTLSLSTVPFQQATQLHISFDWEASVYYGGEFVFSLAAGTEPIAEYSEIVNLTTGSASGRTDWYIGLRPRPATGSWWRFEGLATKSEFAIGYNAADVGKQAIIVARWFNRTGKTGPVSSPITGTIAA